MMASSVLFGVPIDQLTLHRTVDRLGRLIQLGREQGRTHQVATVNVDFLVNALSDPELMALLQRAELNLADGMPLLWASRSLGTPLAERVAGADLVPLLAGASEERGWRIHLFGAAPGVADRARSLMLENHPGATITADAGPSRINVDRLDESIAMKIRGINPDVLCVALGNPKQERFVATYREALQCPVMVGIGGSLDMLIGDKRRAPELVQRAGAEWVFRAAQEPGRLGRRYAHDLRVFGPEMTTYWRTVRRHRGAPQLRLDMHGKRLALRADGAPADRIQARWPTGADLAGIELDLEGVDALRPLDHARLVDIIREAALARITGVDDPCRSSPPGLFRRLSHLVARFQPCRDMTLPSLEDTFLKNDVC